MKKILLLTAILILTISGCTSSDKYASEAIPKEEQIIDFEITEVAFEKLIERMKREENDEIAVLIKGGCWGTIPFGIVLDEQQATDHYIYNVENIYIAIPNKTEDYVEKLIIDFEEEEFFETFVVKPIYK